MSLHRLTPADLVGKTIKSADTSSVNVVHLSFEDGETLSLWAEFGPIRVPELLVDKTDNNESD